jgi:transposase-like protein
MLGFKSFNTARRILKGIEAMNMIRKGQIDGLNRSVLSEIELINKIFGLTT